MLLMVVLLRLLLFFNVDIAVVAVVVSITVPAAVENAAYLFSVG